MNEINIRRSIRRFTDKPLTDMQIEQLLKAAMQAPSAGNAQTWEFVVVKNKNTFLKIMNIHPYATPLQTADTAIVVCGNTRRERYDGFWVQDCSAAIQNLLLKAVSLNLGAVWLGIHPIQERVDALSALLELPKDIIPLGIVAVGHPAEGYENQYIDRFHPEYIHNEKWSK
ncbi:MAG: nitroreductase family protein [Oscillospiraceae bacterium]|nr:nitroreductase family protein [Oscillospiraceae bacterium]